MTITVETEEYDTRRWSKPWIAVVVAWPPDVGMRPEVRWGGWIGRPGHEGLLTVEADMWDIVRTGQRYYRDPDQSERDWWIVGPDGRLCPTTATDAYRLWLARLERPVESKSDMTVIFSRQVW